MKLFRRFSRLALLAAFVFWHQALIAQTITAESPQLKNWSRVIRASGVVAAWQEAIIVSRVNGQPLTVIQVDVGSQVKKNQVLALYDDRNAKADVAQSLAALSSAQVSLKQAEASKLRMQALAGSGAVSEESIQLAVTQFETAQAQVAQTQAALDAAKIRLENTIVRAPDAGVISQRAATLGQAHFNSAELFRMIRQNRLEWHAELPAAQLSVIRPGQSAMVQLNESKQVQGKVRLVSPTIDPNTRLGLVHVDLSANDELKPAMFLEGVLALGSSEALVLPAESIVIRDGKPVVFVVSGGTVQRRSIVTGRRQGAFVEVMSGLKPSEQVAVKGAGLLADSSPVQIVPANQFLAK